MEKVKAIYISLDCLSESIPLSQKIVFGILNTFSSSKEGYRLATGHTVLSLAVRSGTDPRTVRGSLTALEKRGAIKQVKGGFHVFPWPSEQVQAGEEVEGGVALEPGATEAPAPATETPARAAVCLAGYKDARAIVAAIKTGELPGLTVDSVDNLVGTGITNEDYSALRKFVGQAASYAGSIDSHRIFSLQEMLDAKKAFDISVL